MDILGGMWVALKAEILADRNFFNCIILLASVRDLIKQLRVPADNGSLEGMYKSSWRLDRFLVPVLHMKHRGCSRPGCKEGCRKPWLMRRVGLESQSCQPHACTWANESTVCLPTSEKKLLRFWKLHLPKCLLVCLLYFDNSLGM